MFNIHYYAKLAILCKYAYLDNISQHVTKHFDKVVFLNSGVAQCWIFYKKENKQVIVSFRGSDSIQDISRSLCMVPQEFGNYGFTAHSGYLKYYMSLRPHLFRYFTEHGKDIEVATFIGHSMGGACAIMASYDFAMAAAAKAMATTNANVSCVTFGCPTMADTAFCNSFIKYVPNSLAFRNADDIVHIFPFPNFKHPCRINHILLKNKKDNYAKRVLSYRSSNNINTTKMLKQRLKYLDNHDINSYIRNINTRYYRFSLL